MLSLRTTVQLACTVCTLSPSGVRVVRGNGAGANAVISNKAARAVSTRDMLLGLRRKPATWAASRYLRRTLSYLTSDHQQKSSSFEAVLRMPGKIGRHAVGARDRLVEEAHGLEQPVVRLGATEAQEA